MKDEFMRSVLRPATLVLLVLAVTLPAAADKAKDLYAKGQDAEARQNFEVAFDFYKQAYDLKPKELRYRASFERTRFLAGASHVHRGQLLRDGGKLQEALEEFQKAMEIDPSSFIAQQEFRRTKDLINQTTNPQAVTAPPPSGLRRRVTQSGGPIELAPISNVPITLS
jgi:general secretion pathway protein D